MKRIRLMAPVTRSKMPLAIFVVTVLASSVVTTARQSRGEPLVDGSQIGDERKCAQRW
jgi:hypothetical protein